MARSANPRVPPRDPSVSRGPNRGVVEGIAENSDLESRLPCFVYDQYCRKGFVR